MNIAITEVTSNTGKLAKEKPSKADYNAGVLTQGTYQVYSFYGFDRMQQLSDYIKGLQPSQALILGTPKDGSFQGTIASKRVATSNDITRTKEHFDWHQDGRSFLLIDIDDGDVENFSLANTNQVREYLISCDPRMETSAMLIVPSSSQRYNPDDHSWHVYIGCTNVNSATVDQYANELQAKVWLMGHGQIKVGAAGSLLERQVFDKAVFSPERLVLEGVFSRDPNVQFHDIHHFVQEGELLDISIPLGVNIEAAKRLMEQEKIKKRPEAVQMRSKRELEEKQQLITKGMSEEQAQQYVVRKYGDKILPAMEIIRLHESVDGKTEYTAGEIKVYPEKFEGLYCADPYSIEDGTQKAYILSNGDIYSHKHGGYKIKLEASTEYIIKKVVALHNSPSRDEARETLEHIRMLCSTTKIERTTVKEIAGLLKSKGYITSVRDFEVIPQSIFERRDGRLIDSDTNLIRLLEKYNFLVGYDQIRKEVIVQHHTLNSGIDNIVDTSYSLLYSYAVREGLPGKIAKEHLVAVAKNKFAFNPLTNMVENAMKRYDGHDYIADLASCLVVKDEDHNYTYELVKRWLIQCVAAWYHAKHVPNNPDAKTKFESVLCLLGPQGIQKTKFLSKLLDFKGYSLYFKEGVKLKPTDKDSVKQAISRGIVEIGELDATFRQSDVAELKAFFSNNTDELRLPYDRSPSEYARRTSFAASINEYYFLIDKTGNRRYWILDLEKIDFTKVESIDMERVWGQVGHLYMQGYRWWFDPSDPKDQAIWQQIERVQARHYMGETVNDVIAEVLKTINSIKGKIETKPISPTRILQAFGIVSPKKTQIAQLKLALQKEGIKPHKSGQFYIPAFWEQDQRQISGVAGANYPYLPRSL